MTTIPLEGSTMATSSEERRRQGPRPAGSQIPPPDHAPPAAVRRGPPRRDPPHRDPLRRDPLRPAAAPPALAAAEAAEEGAAAAERDADVTEPSVTGTAFCRPFLCASMLKYITGLVKPR